ncbi:hypothetical protein J5500_01030 [Candidatus Saccharibacteria bacterium]|nr:hypothetical protein [Candidatus Saccharibacteria bacterium]
MNILKFTTKLLITAGIITTLAAAPSFAAVIENCVGEDTSYPSLSTNGGDGTDYPVRCMQAQDPETNKYVTIYGKTAADCTQASTIANDPESNCAYTSSEPIDSDVAEGTMSEEPGEEDTPDEEYDNPQEETAADTAGPSESTAKKDEGLPVVAIIGIIAGIVALVAIVIIVIVMIKKKGNKNTPNTPTTPTTDQTPQDNNPFATPGAPTAQ